jgi:hypothetical protein
VRISTAALAIWAIWATSLAALVLTIFGVSNFQFVDASNLGDRLESSDGGGIPSLGLTAVDRSRARDGDESRSSPRTLLTPS